MNKPGIVMRIQALADHEQGGVRRRSVFLHVRFADGRPGAIYAACSLPPGPGPHPAVVHCPGGGQTVDAADLAWWAGHGFACAAFDWQTGCWPGHDPACKSAWPPGVVHTDFPPPSREQALLPLAVQGVGAVIDWLQTMSEVDAGQVGCTGISWGGYLCWLAGTLEPRLRAIVPVYGCGGLFDPCRGWAGTASPVAAWYGAACDPAALAAQVRAPAAYLGASNDFFGWPAVADALLDRLPVASRRGWAPNLDHTVSPGESALALAWMRHHLAGGPALPAAPRWSSGRLEVDRTQQMVSEEIWWSPTPGPDPDRCWWPGEAPADAPVAARLARVFYAGGVVLSTAVEPGGAAERARQACDLGERWGDLRAGLGVRCGTQLHGNACAVTALPAGGVRVRRNGESPVSLLALADPRWNRPGFAGLRLRVGGGLARRLGLVLGAGHAAGSWARRQWRGEAAIADDGTVVVDRAAVPLPADVPWSAIRRLDLEGLGCDFSLADLTRLSKDGP